MLFGNRQNIAWFHGDFYRNCYHKALNVLLVLIAIMLCLIAAIIYVVLTQPHSSYYASTTNGVIIPMTPQSVK